MPTYEYECERCGHRFERFQRISDDPVRICPECGGTVRRVISTGGGIVFKGPGFYATDYARRPKPGNGGAKAAGGGSSDAEPKGDSGSGTTGEEGSGDAD
jgi:putative FmdB family regulatory protein